jgi:AraC-like DNA-binding protein
MGGTAVTTPGFRVGEGFAWYRGPAIDASAHRHAAFQVAIGVDRAVSIVDSAEVCHRAKVLVVPPMVRHRMLGGTDLVTFFVEPHCAFADRLRERCGDGITVADDLRGLTEDDLRSTPSTTLDPRLVAAMDEIGSSMAEVAANVGLSPQRLRALARRQLGMPLPRWRVWVRLRRTAEALRDGQSLADAAIVGGFADQAHLTRWMREMMGLTPAAALPALRHTPRSSR